MLPSQPATKDFDKSANRIGLIQQLFCKRKTGPVAESLIDSVTADVPISYGQKFAACGGNKIYVIDAVAAEGIASKEAELKEKGIRVIDKTK